MNKIIKEALVLMAITLVSGLLLGAVYSITKQPIAQAEEKAQKEAYLAVFPDAQDLTEPDNKEQRQPMSWIRPDLAQLTLWKIFIWQKRTEQ